jgi:hypothetical protein
VNGIGMDECDLEPKEALPRSLVDQLGPFGREPPELHEDILDLVGDMVHSRAALCEEPADRRFFTERRKQLDATRADEHRCGFDTLFLDTCSVLELGAEQALIRVERVVQVVDGDAEMMDAAGLHGPMLQAAGREAALQGSRAMSIRFRGCAD